MIATDPLLRCLSVLLFLPLSLPLLSWLVSLIALQELQGKIDIGIREYEERFGERFVKPTNIAAMNLSGTHKHT